MEYKNIYTDGEKPSAKNVNEEAKDVLSFIATALFLCRCATEDLESFGAIEHSAPISNTLFDVEGEVARVAGLDRESIHYLYNDHKCELLRLVENWLVDKTTKVYEETR